LRETIGSPVRLFATSDLAIGPYGTAVWIDSHTEDYFFHADRGQRLAGKFSSYVGTEEDEEIELSDQIATATATSVYSYHEEDSWVKIALDEEEGRIFSWAGRWVDYCTRICLIVSKNVLIRFF